MGFDPVAGLVGRRYVGDFVADDLFEQLDVAGLGKKWMQSDQVSSGIADSQGGAEAGAEFDGNGPNLGGR